MTSEWKSNKTNLLLITQHAFRTFKKDTEIPERKIRPPFGATSGLKSFSHFSEQEGVDIFKIYWSLGDNNTQRILSLNVLISHQTRQKFFEALSECAT